jgi:hypothetical protein
MTHSDAVGVRDRITAVGYPIRTPSSMASGRFANARFVACKSSFFKESLDWMSEPCYVS